VLVCFLFFGGVVFLGLVGVVGLARGVWLFCVVLSRVLVGVVWVCVWVLFGLWRGGVMVLVIFFGFSFLLLWGVASFVVACGVLSVLGCS